MCSVVGHRYLQHARGGWKGQHLLLYHIYMIREAVDLQEVVPFPDGPSLRRKWGGDIMATVTSNVPNSLESDDVGSDKISDVGSDIEEPEDSVTPSTTEGLQQISLPADIDMDQWYTNSEFLFVIIIKSVVIFKLSDNFFSCEAFIQAVSDLCFILFITMPLYLCTSRNCYHSTTSLYSLRRDEVRSKNLARGSIPEGKPGPQERIINAGLENR